MRYFGSGSGLVASAFLRNLSTRRRKVVTNYKLHALDTHVPRLLLLEKTFFLRLTDDRRNYHTKQF